MNRRFLRRPWNQGSLCHSSWVRAEATRKGPSSLQTHAVWEPGPRTSPLGPISPGYSNIFTYDDEDDGEDCPVFTQQSHEVDAWRPSEEEATQVQEHRDTHWKKHWVCIKIKGLASWQGLNGDHRPGMDKTLSGVRAMGRNRNIGQSTCEQCCMFSEGREGVLEWDNDALH